MKRAINNIIESIINVFLIVMLFINLFNIVERNINNKPMPKIFGYGYAIVVSGSMEPEISVNDVVYMHQQDTYEVGDIITFVEYEPGQFERTKNTSLITHRIVDVTKDGYYITKGDANNTADMATVSKDKIEGKIFAILPGAGIPVTYMRKPIGTLWMMLLALLLIELPYQLQTRKRIASETQRKVAVSKLRPAMAGASFTPDEAVEADPEQLLLNGMKPRRRKERAPYVPPKPEKKSLFHRKPKVYVPEEGHWSL